MESLPTPNFGFVPRPILHLPSKNIRNLYHAAGPEFDPHRGGVR
jgi:hypothetical protein